MMLKKPIYWRSQDYLDFIASKPCLICSKKAIYHHEPLGMSGTSIKAPDSHCLPLCEDHHIPGVHAAPKSFWEVNNIDPKMEIIKLLTEFLNEKDIK